MRHVGNYNKGVEKRGAYQLPPVIILLFNTLNNLRRCVSRMVEGLHRLGIVIGGPGGAFDSCRFHIFISLSY